VENGNRDYVACLKNAVNFLVAYTYKINFYGCSFSCAFTYGTIGHLQVNTLQTSMSRGAQITGAKSQWRLNFMWRSLGFVGPQHGTCFMSLFQRLEL
jgi:hypothetical protein